MKTAPLKKKNWTHLRQLQANCPLVTRKGKSPGILTIVNHSYRNKNVMSFVDIQFCFIFMQDTKDNYSDVLIKQEKREGNHRNEEAEVDK